MTRKKIKSQSPQIPDKIRFRDLFRTPAYAVKLLLPFIPEDIKHVWECASGSGHISRILKSNGYAVFESDIDGQTFNLNFLLEDPISFGTDRFAIITNPPFSLKKKFYDRCMEIGRPFALLIPADYCGWVIDAIKSGCKKLIPTRRISYITPNMLARINLGTNSNFTDLQEVPKEILYKYTSSSFHSMWLTYQFNLQDTEEFVDLSKESMLDIL